MSKVDIDSLWEGGDEQQTAETTPVDVVENTPLAADHAPVAVVSEIATTTTPEPVTVTTTTPPVDTPVVEAQIPYWKNASVFGKEFNDENEVASYLQELTTKANEPKQIYKTEIAEKLDQFLADKKGTEDDFFKIANRDYSKLPDLDKIKEHILLTSKDGLTEDDINFEITNKYQKVKLQPLDEFSSEEEKAEYRKNEDKNRLVDIQLKRDAARANEFLENNKAKYAVSKAAPTAEQIAQQQQYEQTIQNNIADYKANVTQKQNIEEDISLDDTNGVVHKFKYQITQDDKDFATKVFAGETEILNRYINDKKEFNGEAFTRDMIRLNNFDNMLKAAARDAYNLGKEQMLTERTNPSLAAEPVVNHSKKGINLSDFMFNS